MKATLNRAELRKALTHMARYTPSRTGLPILKGVKLTATDGQLEVYGTDLDITAMISVPADVERDGTVLVDLRTFKEATSKGTGAVVLAADGHDQLHMGATTLRTMALDDYPRIPLPEGELVAHCVTSEFMAAAAAVSYDQQRPILTGIYLDVDESGFIRWVSTDSYRLVTVDTATTLFGKGKVILPWRKGFKYLPDLIGDTFELRLTEREAILSGPRGTVVGRLIEGSFPTYEKLLPDDSTLTTVIEASREAWLTAIGPCAAIAEDGKVPIRVNIDEAGDNGTVSLSATQADVGGVTEVLETRSVESPTPGYKTAFSSKYLTDGIMAVTSAAPSCPNDVPARRSVILGQGDPLKPALVVGANSGVTYLVMPVRL